MYKTLSDKNFNPQRLSYRVYYKRVQWYFDLF